MNYESHLQLPQTSAVLSSGAQLLGSVHEEMRLSVPLSRISESLLRAVVAVEDRRFFSHHGIDWRAVARAAVVNVRRRRIVQGGSTISQQLARNVILRRADRTFRRKILESLVAYRLERALEKPRILEAYLNSAYFGHGLYGVQIAALAYFGKMASDLSDHEAALLAGMLKAPGRYCKCCFPQSASHRGALVLRLMNREATRSTSARVYQARRTAQGHLRLTGAYILEMVRQWLKANAARLYPRNQLVVHTTIDPACQFAVEVACRSPRKVGYRGRLACVVQDAQSGDVKALTGGVDYSLHPFNAAIGRLQPGSVLKPFILLAAIQRGLTLDYKVASRPLELRFGANTWVVRNAGSRYFGEITVADALVLSDNTVFAQLLLEIGLGPVRRLLQIAGINATLATPAIATGAISPGVSPLQVCSAYSAFSAVRGCFGYRLVTRVVLNDGADWVRSIEPVAVCTPAERTLLTGVLQRVAREGTGRLAYSHPDLSSKTGTSVSGGWYVSYDNNYRVLTWTEADFPSANVRAYESKGVTAKGLAERIWRLLDEKRRGFSEMFGAFAGVERMTVQDLLYVEREFQAQ